MNERAEWNPGHSLSRIRHLYANKSGNNPADFSSRRPIYRPLLIATLPHPRRHLTGPMQMHMRGCMILQAPRVKSQQCRCIYCFHYFVCLVISNCWSFDYLHILRGSLSVRRAGASSGRESAPSRSFGIKAFFCLTLPAVGLLACLLVCWPNYLLASPSVWLPAYLWDRLLAPFSLCLLLCLRMASAGWSAWVSVCLAVMFSLISFPVCLSN